MESKNRWVIALRAIATFDAEEDGFHKEDHVCWQAAEAMEVLVRENKDWKELAKELHEHLEYCGWGDSWEREGAGDLMKKAGRMLAEEDK